jgi:hypothetical protein
VKHNVKARTPIPVTSGRKPALGSSNASRQKNSIEADTYLLEVAAADREAFVLCLALGTLEAIRAGNWPLEAGVWTLGRPAFLHPLSSGALEPAVLAELQAVDELQAMAGLVGHVAVEEKLNFIIAVVRSRLSVLKDRSWYARWSKTPSDWTANAADCV